MEFRKVIEADLSEAREHLRRSIEGVTAAQERVDTLDGLLRGLTPEREAFAASLLKAGVVEEPRPF